MSKKFINSFNKGIDRDTSVNKYDNQHYFEAINLRITSENSLSNGALSLIDGTLSKAAFKDRESLLGYTVIRDTMIIFVYHPDGGRIYKYVDDGTTNEQIPVLIYTSSDLVFYENTPIIAIGLYEKPDIQKIYFTDGEHFFYHLNTYSASYPISDTDVPVNQLELVSDVVFNSISSEITPGGNLQASRIEYSYQFYNKNGAETVFSPTSNLISLVAEKDGAIDSFNYKGADQGTTINKSIDVTITNTSDTYDRVRLIALEYTTYNQIPNIRIVGEYEISDGTTSVPKELSILDSGQSIGSLTLEEFRFIQNDIIPKTLEVKENRLLAANITYNYFDLSSDYDTRAFRWKNTAGTYSCIVKDGNNDIIVPSDLSTLPDLDAECFNPYNNLDNDSASGTNDYKYNPDTGELGGKGKYIKYRFTTTQVVLDDNIKTYDAKMGYPRILSKVTNPVQNYANPFTDIGYQRDETYRFAIVFLDTKGRISFANWIGDIRFPNQTELPFIEYNSSDGKTYANILGIEFYVDLESDATATTVRDSISGFQIVRAKRDTKNSTILEQGTVGYTTIGRPNGNNDDTHRYCLTDLPYAYECYNKNISDRRDSEFIADLSDADSILGNDDSVTDLDPYTVEFTSPTSVFNKITSTLDDAFLEVIGVLTDEQTARVNQDNGGSVTEGAQLTYSKFMGFTASDYSDSTRITQNDFVDYKIYTPLGRANTDGDASQDACLYTLPSGEIYNNQCCNIRNSDTKFGIRGTYLQLNFDSTVANSELAIPNNALYTTEAARVLFGNIRINKNRTIYGGTGYEDRKNTEYIKASGIFDSSTTWNTVYGGDTYINTFVYLRCIFDDVYRVGGDRAQSMLAFPVESKINLDLRLDEIQRYTQWGRPAKEFDGEVIANYALTEIASDGVSLYGSYYPTNIGDLYRYNSAYSTEDVAFVYFEKPFDYVVTDIVDTRITSSEKKTNGEYTDSWLKFKFNDFLDVDSKYHEIIRLLNVNNTIYFFQPKAVGAVSINDRSLITDGNAAQLSLGTGGILSRYDYLTTMSGISTYHAVTKSDKTFYYVDKLRKRFYVFTGSGDEPISVAKGLNSYMAQLSYDTVEVEFDPQYSEILANIDGTIVVYNEFINAFISFYSYNPSNMFRLGGQLYINKEVPGSEDTNIVLLNNTDYALHDDNPISRVIYRDEDYTPPRLYKLNAGDAGSFYSEAGVPGLSCSLTLVVNPNGNIVNTFDTVDLRTDVTDSNGDDVYNETVSSMIASNNYQNFSKTLTYSIDPNVRGTIEKFARVWRTSLLPSQDYSANGNRLVDTFLMLKLTYDSNGNDFKIHDVISYYRPKKETLR